MAVRFPLRRWPLPPALAVWLLLGSLSVSTLAERKGKRKQSREGQIATEESDAPPPDFPEQLFEKFVSRTPPPKLLGKGGFGTVWKVQDKETGREENVKLFNTDCKGGQGQGGYLLHGDLRRPECKAVVRSARVECNMAELIEERASKASDKAAERFLKCYGHNLVPGEQADEQDVLYLRLSYNGQFSLYRYIHSPQLGELLKAEDGKNIFKQLLEALDVLQQPPVIIHHDLKPENIIVLGTEQGDDYVFSIRLIDFGAMVETEKKSACDITESTLEYAPPELGSFALLRWGVWCAELNYEPDLPDMFDTYSLGPLFVNLFTGMSTYDFVRESSNKYCELLRTACEQMKREKAQRSGLEEGGFELEVTSRVCQEGASYCSRMQPFADKPAVYIADKMELEDIIGTMLSPFAVQFFLSLYRPPDAMGPFKSFISNLGITEQGRSFLQLVLRCFSYEPRDRTTVKALLEHPWIRDLETPMPPQAASHAVQAEGAAAAGAPDEA